MKLASFLLTILIGYSFGAVASEDINSYAKQIYKISSSMEDTITIYGTPHSIEDHTLKVRHPSMKSSSMHILSYDTFQITFWRGTYADAKYPQKQLIDSVQFSSCEPIPISPCMLNATRGYVIERFGMPSATYSTDNVITYMVQHADMGSSPVKFHLVDGVVRSVEIHAFID